IRKPFNRAELIAELQRFLKPAQPREQSSADTLPSASPIEAEAPVPAEALAQRSGLLAKLRQEQQTVWPELCQSLAMDEIEQFVGTVLRNEGYDVMPAGSGPQALERVRVRLPDLILLDLMMPEMDGLEVCRRLKTDPAAQRIPIIFLTASNEMEHLVKGFGA